MLSINECMLNIKLGLSCVDNCLSFFHKQILQCWDEAYDIEPVSNSEILNEYLYNKEIKIGKRLVTMKQFPNKYVYNLKF